MVCAGFVAGAALVLWSRPLATSVLSDLKWESALPLAIGGGAMIAVALLASLCTGATGGSCGPDGGTARLGGLGMGVGGGD